MVSSVLALSEGEVRSLSKATAHKASPIHYRLSNTPITVHLTIFIFRGRPVDTYYNRHVLLYFTSPQDVTFHETVHVQRAVESGPWQLGQLHREIDWIWDVSYIGHVNAGSVKVLNEMTPVEIVASTPTTGREAESEWNCQHFLLEGLREIVRYGLQTQDWYDFVEGELMERLLDGAVP